MEGIPYGLCQNSLGNDYYAITLDRYHLQWDSSSICEQSATRKIVRQVLDLKAVSCILQA